MREIKFRWFHKPSGKIANWDMMLIECDRLSMLLPCEDWVVMQYTGLKDKNGKEIYEGDIVKFPSFDKYHCEVYYLPRQIFTATMERFPTFWLKEEKFGYEGELLLQSWESEIIGNIHEHKHLIEESDE